MQVDLRHFFATWNILLLCNFEQFEFPFDHASPISYHIQNFLLFRHIRLEYSMSLSSTQIQRRPIILELTYEKIYKAFPQVLMNENLRRFSH